MSDAETNVRNHEGEGSNFRKLRCRTVATGRLGHRTYIRELPPLGAEPANSSSLTDEAAPSPCEALLAALGSCLSIGIHANAVARAIPIRHLEIDIEGDIGVAGLWGTGDLTPRPLGFETIIVRVRIEADVSNEILEALVEHTAMWSPVANTLHNPVHLDVVVEKSTHETAST
jgi:uncharacterized OsmC-like protein